MCAVCEGRRGQGASQTLRTADGAFIWKQYEIFLRCFMSEREADAARREDGQKSRDPAHRHQRTGDREASPLPLPTPRPTRTGRGRRRGASADGATEVRNFPGPRSDSPLPRRWRCATPVRWRNGCIRSLRAFGRCAGADAGRWPGGAGHRWAPPLGAWRCPM